MFSNKIKPKSGSYHGHFVVESLGNIAVFFRWDNELGEASADFCVDGTYTASMRAEIGNYQLRNAKLRASRSQNDVQLEHIAVQVFTSRSLQLTCNLPILPNVLCIQLTHQSKFFRQLEVVCYAPKRALEGDLALKSLYPAIRKHLANAGIRAMIRTGYPALPKNSSYGYQDLECWEERELHELMESRSPAVSTPRLWRMNLLFVPRFDGGPFLDNGQVKVKGWDSRGTMFDRRRGNITGIWHLAVASGLNPSAIEPLSAEILEQIQDMSLAQRYPLFNDTVRQAAAIFYRPFERFGDFAKPMMVHTIMHEIGHVFNLRHTQDDDSVMDEDFSSHNMHADYEEDELRQIRHGYFDDVAPGGYTEFLAPDSDILTEMGEDYGLTAVAIQPFVRQGEALDVLVSLRGKFDLNNLHIRLLVRKMATNNRQERFLEYIPKPEQVRCCVEGNNRYVLRIDDIELDKLGCTSTGCYGLQAGAAHPNGHYFLFGRVSQEFNVIGPKQNPNIHRSVIDFKPQAFPELEGRVRLPLGRSTKVYSLVESEVDESALVPEHSDNAIIFQQFGDELTYELQMIGLSHSGRVIPGTVSPIRMVGQEEGREYEMEYLTFLKIKESDGGGQGSVVVIMVPPPVPP